MTRKNKAKRPVALAPKPVMMKSRKKARKVTTMFHKLTRERDAALQKGDKKEIARCDQLLQEMGGREEYQRASQLSTSFHSTSKWVLGQLANRGWLYGIRPDNKDDDDEGNNNNDNNDDDDDDSKHQKKSKKKKNSKAPRRPTRLLEVGAINTELLDAAEETKEDEQQQEGEHINQQETSTSTVHTSTKKYRLDVRAIDIHSMDKERIEEMDFLQLPYTHADPQQRFDVIVCSMVINCVTTPEDRGRMLLKLYNHLRPGGLLFLTLPLFCLTKSAFLTHGLFQNMLGKGGVGFEVVETKNSPRLAFFICRRPENIDEENRKTAIRSIWKKQIIRNRGKKFPNQFSVVLPNVDDDDDDEGEDCIDETEN